jgi:CBS domain-containing protein
MITYESNAAPVLTLEAKPAADLMVPKLVWVRPTTTVQEAVSLLTEKGISAIPVLDEDGEAVGVLSLSDIVAHDNQNYAHLQPGEEYYRKQEFVIRLKETRPRLYQIEQTKAVLVQDIMTPVVYSVARNAAAATVVDAMLSLGVHRLFVTDEDGKIVGVISTLDIIRHLHRPKEVLSGPSDDKEALCEVD